MLRASTTVDLFERYRIPYSVGGEAAALRGLHAVARSDGSGPELLWLAAGTTRNEGRLYRFDGATVYLELPTDSDVSTALETTGRAWLEAEPILDLAGERRTCVYRAADGSILLPFDINASTDAFLREGYIAGARAGRLQEVVRDLYYRIRPLLPRRLQLTMRRRFLRVQDRTTFPGWPAETSLHRFEALLLRAVEEIAGEPLPWISAWPAPYEWALVLTHDVERAAGYGHIGTVRAVEERRGLRSAWYLVPESDYQVETSLLERLERDGCEICLHGLRHDGRDLAPGTFEERLPAMQRYAKRWGATGFRGPATLRNYEYIPRLGMLHDSSWSDVARYEPQPGGSCSWLPFFIGDVVELPITMPMDHTIFELLGETTGALWREKVALLREHHGMAVMLTHPDYLLDPSLLRLYGGFVDEFGSDDTAWHALPREVAVWWRERSRTRLELHEGRWTPEGPGAERAVVRLGAPPLPYPTDELRAAVVS